MALIAFSLAARRLLNFICLDRLPSTFVAVPFPPTLDKVHVFPDIRQAHKREVLVIKDLICVQGKSF